MEEKRRRGGGERGGEDVKRRLVFSQVLAPRKYETG